MRKLWTCYIKPDHYSYGVFFRWEFYIYSSHYGCCYTIGFKTLAAAQRDFKKMAKHLGLRLKDGQIIIEED